MVLMTVTERMIRSLAFQFAEQVIESAAKNLSDERKG